MESQLFFKLLLIGLCGHALSAMPRPCRYIRSQKKVECKLAKLYKTIRSLDMPSDAQIVSLTNNELTNAPQIQRKIEILSSLRVLDLSYNNIPSGTRDLVAKNPTLEEFYMRNNLLRSIHERTFEKNRALKKVDISNNLIGALPRKMFQNNPRLEAVLLWANDLSTLPEDLFRTNKDLELINLSWNRLTDIPETFFRGLTKLKKVMLWKNQLTCLYSSMFLDNVQLNTFHVAINFIKKVPDKIFDNTPDLVDVRIWSNKLGCIPKEVFRNNDKIGYVNLLLGNDNLPWALKQRFSKTGLHNVRKMAYKLFTYGNETCTAAPCEWNPETKTMDCSYRDLKDLTGLVEVCEKVRNLNLDGNQLNDPEMLVPAMAQLTEIRELSMRKNKMTGEIKPQTFKSNAQLSSVDLSGNKLTGLPEETFEANSILKEVKVADNEIEKIHENLLVQNPELTEIDLSGNRLKELSKTVFSNSRLITMVKLSENQITTIDEDTFKNNRKLRELDLSNNLIEGEVLVEAFENAPDLETVRLGGNRIVQVKKTDGTRRQQNRTITLELGYNKLEEFPVDMIESRPFLKRLILHHNRIATIPERALHGNKELVEIDLSYNRLTKISNKTFSQNFNLQILRLDHNALTRLDAGILEGNPNLRFFSANGNKIHFISPDLFLFNMHLEEVRLSDNVITKLPEELYRPCGESLRFVTMSKNNIDYLPRRSFDRNENLQQVCLYGNSLSRFPKETIPLDELVSANGETPPHGGVRDSQLSKFREIRESEENNFIGSDSVRRLRTLMAGQARLKEDPDHSEDDM